MHADLVQLAKCLQRKHLVSARTVAAAERSDVGSGIALVLIAVVVYRLRSPPTGLTPPNRYEHVTKRRVFPGYLLDMDEAREVLERLERIEALESGGAPAQVLLEEVRGLLTAAEEWVRAEPGGTDLAETALERCKGALHEAETGTEARAGLC